MSEEEVLTTYIYQTPIVRRTAESVPARFPDDWAQKAIDAIDTKIIPGWEALLVSEANFREKMAWPAATGFVGYLDAAQTTKKGLPVELSIRRHGQKLAASYAKLQAAIAFQFGLGRDQFAQRLQDTRPEYQQGEALPLALTGDYVEGILGAAVRQCFFLDGSDKFAQYRWAGDVLEGALPPDVPFVTGLLQSFAMRLIRLLIQGGCFLLEGHDLTRVHAQLDTLLTERLNLEYGIPPQARVRFLVADGLPAIRTVMARLVTPRLPPHFDPIIPHLDFDIEASENPHIPGNPTARNFSCVFTNDLPHLPSYSGGAEYDGFHGNPGNLPGFFSPAIGPAEKIASSLGTSLTTNPFTMGTQLGFVTQWGYGWKQGEGAYPVTPRMIIENQDNPDDYMLGRVLNYNDNGDGSAFLFFDALDNHGSGVCSAWNIWRLRDAPDIGASGSVDVGEVLEADFRYGIADNRGGFGIGTVHLRVTGVE